MYTCTYKYVVGGMVAVFCCGAGEGWEEGAQMEFHFPFSSFVDYRKLRL